MAEDPQKQEEVVPVSDTQDAPIPSAEQQTPGEITEEAVSTEEQSPSVKEHNAKEFEKLRSQLRDERARREYVENVFTQLQPKTQPEPIIDPDTGFPREDVLNDVQRRAYEAEQRAAKAEQSIQNYLQEQEDRAVFTAHPELNPEGKEFNQELHNLTSSLMLHSMVNPDRYGNKQLSFMEAATKAKSLTEKGMDQARKQGALEALEQLTPKEQASLEAESDISRRGDVEGNLDDLRVRSRNGDLDAIVARLKKAQG